MAAKKMTDVSKPDSTPADATSKPIILGRKPMVSDPMVSADTKEKPVAKQPMASTARSIQPVSEEFTKKPQVEEPGTESKDDTEIVTVKKEDAETEVAKEEVPQNQDEELNTDDQKAEIANQEENTVEDERQQRLKAIIESKKYNVHFKNPHKASAKIFVTTVLVVVSLGALAVLLLDDSGAIDLGINLPFDLIK